MAAESGVSSAKRISKSRKWHWWRQAVQILALLLFLYFLLGTRQESVSAPHDIFFHLDPLAGIASMLAARSFIEPMLLGIITLLLTLAVARAWCGWICPLGTLLDWTPARSPQRKSLDIPAFWRQGKYLLLFIILLAAILGSLTLIVLDPITLLFRTIAGFVLPVLGSLLTGLESWLYGVSLFQPAVGWFDNLARGTLLTGQPFFVANVALAVVFAAVLALNAVRKRFWCRYLCPLGGLLGLVSKAAQIRHKVDEKKCIACQHCALICPTGAIDPEQKFVANSAECTACLDCMETCPQGAITFSAQPGIDAHKRYDPSRRQFLGTLGLAAAGAVLLRFMPLLGRKEAALIRPPGSSEALLQSKCIRCGLCVRVCPTGVIQSSPNPRNGQSLWTPMLATRLGYCDYSCNACGQVCPTGAIEELPLEEKRNRVIGIARIDQRRCIPWSEGRECIVCEEMCPVPQKAIHLNGGGSGNRGGRAGGVALPRVREELCIGCGICEHQCPVAGEAAIRIFPVNNEGISQG